MIFARYFKTSSYCMIAAGFLAIASTGSLDSISIVMFAAAFIASLFVDTVRLRQIIPARALPCIAVASLVFCFMDYRFVSRSSIIAAMHLVFFLAAIKLLTLSKDRDYLQLYIISLAQVLAASALTVNLVFGISLLIYIFFGISTLILFEMRRSNARMQDAARVQLFVSRRGSSENGMELFSRFPAGLFFLTTIGTTLLILAVSIPLFLVLPRIARGFHRQPSGATHFISGFSDHVELGQIGSIKQSDAVVMRVKTNRTPSEIPADIKWRGLSFDHFDGRSWKRTDQRRFSIPTQGKFYKLENSTQGTDWLNQSFFMEALSTNVVFAARKVLAVSQDIGPLQKDSSNSLYTEPRRLKKVRYSAISDLSRPDPSNIIDSSPIPPEVLSTYLQLPQEDPRIEHLAKRITGSAMGGYTKARALERYLRNNYSYSLVLRGSPRSKDPLAMFLFDVRKGHCEYFATAMTIMLRHLGIPARMVNGFHAGEYNHIGNNWIVRQYNAHSWVEAYFPPYGWIEFDPTPSDPAHPQTGLAFIISNLTDAIDLWWWEGIVNYDSSKQYTLFSNLQTSIENLRNSTARFFARLYGEYRARASAIGSSGVMSTLGRKWFMWVPFVALGSLLFVHSWRKRVLGSMRRRLLCKDSRAAAVDFYEEALSMLGDRGYKLRHGQTPMEFARSLTSHSSGKFFMALTRLYNEIRFGPPGQTYSHREVQMQLRLLRNSLRKQ